jgi:magnesium transporter
MRVFSISDNFKEVNNCWKPGTNYYWIVAEAKEAGSLVDKLAVEEESLEECKNLKQSAKISFFKNYLFIVFNILEYGDSGIFSRELNIFLGKDYILTVYKEHSDIIEEMLADIGREKNCFKLSSLPRPCIILYYILDRIIVRNYNVISDLEEQADRIEISILKKPQREKAHELINLRRQVYRTRKFLNPLRYIGDSLVINDNGIIDREHIRYFESINRKIDKLMLSLENLVQDLALAREAFESETANQTNELMKIFTLIAAIFLPLELIGSIFGMNFDYMPLKGHIYGYYIVLTVMVLIVVYLIYLFVRNKWL